jgi:HEAT repeat protein
MAKPSEFEGRMLAILDPRRRRRGPGRVQMTWLVGTLAMLALVVGAVSPARRATATPPEPGGHVRGAPLTRDENADDSKANQPPAADPTGAAYRQDESATDSRSKDKDKDKGKDVASDTVVDREIDREKSGDSETDAVDEAKNAQKAQVLAKALRNDSDAEVRRVAAWGLERYADHEVAAKALAEAVGRDANEDVREMSAWALAESKSPATITTINAAFRNDKSRKVRQTAAWAAGSIGSPSSVDGLATLLSDTDPDMREVAAWSIGSCSPQRAPAALIKALNDSNRDVRLSAAWALGEIGDASAANEIDAAFRREKDPEVQHGLIRALGSMGDSAIPTLTRLVDSSSPEVRAVAVQALAGGHMSEPWPWPRPEPRPFP